MRDPISIWSVLNHKGIIYLLYLPVENQKGASALDFVHSLKLPSGSQWWKDNALLTPTESII